MENQKQPNEVMNGDEAAVFLKMPKSTLLKLCSEGQLPGVKVGRQWRFHRDALEKWNAARNAENVVETAVESVDFSQSLTKAVARVDRNIKPVVEEFVGSVGDDEFETTGEVRELDDSADSVGEVKELPPTKSTKGTKKPSPSALELMAQISAKTQGRRPGRPPKAKTSLPSAQPAPVQEAAAREKRSELIRETFRDKTPDTDAVEISRPYTKPNTGARPSMPEQGRKKNAPAGVFKKLVYAVIVLAVLALAGMGVKTLLIPISILDSASPTATGTQSKLPSLPVFQTVYKHVEPEEDTPAAAVPQQGQNRPIQAVAPPVAQASPSATPATQPTPAATPVTQAAPEVASHTNTPIAPPAVDKGLEAINRIMPALFQLPGCLVKSTNSDILITFQDGIFSGGGLKIDKEGRAQLARVAEFLSANAPEFWLIVEGQTNAQPLRSGSPYRDNYTLGLRRAVAATEVVRNDSKFPSDRLMASSAGGNPPPFEMTQPGAESKNRTVRFRLIPKIGGPSDTQ